MDLKSRWKEFKVSMAPRTRELKFMLSRVKKSPLSLVGTSIIVFYVILAILAPVLAPPWPHRNPFMIPKSVWYPVEPQPPSSQHIFGTEQNQWDIWYGCIWGTITAFRVGAIVVGTGLIIGIIIGTLAGYYGGIVDELMMRLTDIFLAFPGLVLCIALVVAIPTPWTILQIGPLKWSLALGQFDKLLFALALVAWPGYCRVIRGEVMRIKTEDYIQASKAVGCSDFRIMTMHILPNSIYPILIMASLDIGSVVLLAAALSFLGIGSPPGYADWGQLINLSQPWVESSLQYWYTYTIPGLFIFTFVLGWNLLGDAFRDILDPMLRRR
jgi:peptide/nickel transport system permease protein